MDVGVQMEPQRSPRRTLSRSTSLSQVPGKSFRGSTLNEVTRESGEKREGIRYFRSDFDLIPLYDKHSRSWLKPTVFVCEGLSPNFLIHRINEYIFRPLPIWSDYGVGSCGTPRVQEVHEKTTQLPEVEYLCPVKIFEVYGVVTRSVLLPPVLSVFLSCFQSTVFSDLI